MRPGIGEGAMGLEVLPLGFDRCCLLSYKETAVLKVMKVFVFIIEANLEPGLQHSNLF